MLIKRLSCIQEKLFYDRCVGKLSGWLEEMEESAPWQGSQRGTWRGAKILDPLANFEVVLNKANVSVRPWPKIDF